MLEAKDTPNGGPVSVSIVIEDSSGQRTTINVPTTPSDGDPDLYTGMHPWVPPTDYVYMEFVAADSDNALSVLVPEIIVCVCQNEATCNWNNVQVRRLGCLMSIYNKYWIWGTNCLLFSLYSRKLLEF